MTISREEIEKLHRSHATRSSRRQVDQVLLCEGLARARPHELEDPHARLGAADPHVQDRQQREEPDERAEDRVIGGEGKGIAGIGETERWKLDTARVDLGVEAEAGNAQRFESRECLEKGGEIRKVELQGSDRQRLRTG